MNINFPSIDESFIKNMVEGGYYSNATELVRDAVRRLRQQDNGAYAGLMAALETGELAVKEGRTIAYTPEFLDDCEKRAHENLAHGLKPNPDVCA